MYVSFLLNEFAVNLYEIRINIISWLLIAEVIFSLLYKLQMFVWVNYWFLTWDLFPPSAPRTFDFIMNTFYFLLLLPLGGQVNFFDFYGRKLNTCDVGVSCKSTGTLFLKSNKGYHYFLCSLRLIFFIGISINFQLGSFFFLWVYSDL